MPSAEVCATCPLQGNGITSVSVSALPLALALTALLLLQEKMVSYPKLDFSVQELQERFQRQLEMELDNTVTIESVESTKPLTPQAGKAVKLRESGGKGVGGLRRGQLPGDALCPVSISMQRELLATLRSQWHDSLLQALQKSKRSMARLTTGSGYNTLYPYLCLLPDEEYVAIMMQVGPAWAGGLPLSTGVPFGAAESGHEAHGLPRL